MKKQHVIIGIIALLISVGLSGCNELYNSINSNENEITKIGDITEHPNNYINTTVTIKGTYDRVTEYFFDKVTDRSGIIYISLSYISDTSMLFDGGTYSFTGVVEPYTTFYGDKMVIVNVSRINSTN